MSDFSSLDRRLLSATARLGIQENDQQAGLRPCLPRQRSRHFDSFQPAIAGTGGHGGGLGPSLSPTFTPTSALEKQGYFSDAAWGFNKPSCGNCTGPLLNSHARCPNGWMDLTPSDHTHTPSLMSPGSAERHSFDMMARSQSPAEEEIIPTAIVIKNIPFAVKKEQLLEVMTQLKIPLPYAFNYHFDDRGVFRGLSFANFSAPEEAAVVVNSLNGYEIAGRKLRVEYKKMLPAHERERIEREKQERRGQLLEQHMSATPMMRVSSGLQPRPPSNPKSHVCGSCLMPP